MQKQSRRTFLKTATAAAAAYSVLPGSARADVNSQIRMAVVGFNGRGGSHIEGFNEHLVALCDCDAKVLHRGAEKFEKQYGRKLDQVQDFRRLLERKDIDAISIATPNHTHSLIAILAVQAGKDVYVEKPISQRVWEGRQLAHAAERYQKLVQCGTQSRSNRAIQEAVKYVREGHLGKIQYAIGTCYKPRKSIGKSSTPLVIPKDFDYDLWCGPAAKVDLYRPAKNSVGDYNPHYDWHWDYNTGNGDMGNQGIHQMDIARWFLGETTLSPRILSFGGRLGYDDAGNTANTQVVLHSYAKAPLIFETRGLPKSKAAQANWGSSMDNYRGSRVGVVVQCEGGYVVSTGSYDSVKAFSPEGEEIKSWKGGGDHFKNFLTAVRSRKRSDLNADVVEGHLSSALCHTGGISHQLGEPQTAKDILKSVEHDPLLKDSIERMFAHLRANEVDIDKPAVVVGAPLEMDPAKERITNNTVADDMLRRHDRKPFEVPQIA
ncbi:MAG: Gfo/Idh/MocA family oxidoreductase [Pirellulales bacterium]|nr:Gfo/Idh/MocA family oxidoreductase [Pirellulales bacterium]